MLPDCWSGPTFFSIYTGCSTAERTFLSSDRQKFTIFGVFLSLSGKKGTIGHTINKDTVGVPLKCGIVQTDVDRTQAGYSLVAVRYTRKTPLSLQPRIAQGSNRHQCWTVNTHRAFKTIGHCVYYGTEQAKCCVQVHVSYKSQWPVVLTVQDKHVELNCPASYHTLLQPFIVKRPSGEKKPIFFCAKTYHHHCIVQNCSVPCMSLQ